MDNQSLPPCLSRSVCSAGITRQELTDTVGIHPTCAEEVVKMHITKSSGVDPNITAC